MSGQLRIGAVEVVDQAVDQTDFVLALGGDDDREERVGCGERRKLLLVGQLLAERVVDDGGGAREEEGAQLRVEPGPRLGDPLGPDLEEAAQPGAGRLDLHAIAVPISRSRQPRICCGVASAISSSLSPRPTSLTRK